MWKDGFLSSEASTLVARARLGSAALFEQLFRVNAQALSIEQQIVVASDDSQALLIATFFSRTITNIQAAVLLAERGLPTQAKALLRVSMESLFSLRACLDRSFSDRLIDADSAKRKKHFRKAAQLVERNVMPDPKGVVSQEKLAEIEADNLEANARDVTTAEIAKAAGLEDWYLGVYSLFSSSVHSTVRDLEQYLVVDDDGHVEALINEPDIKPLPGPLICSIEQILMAISAAVRFFGLDDQDHWQFEHDQLRAHVAAEQAKSSVPG
jgi:hypothetical protein